MVGSILAIFEVMQHWIADVCEGKLGGGGARSRTITA